MVFLLRRKSGLLPSSTKEYVELFSWAGGGWWKRRSLRLSCLFFLFCLQLWVFFLVAEVDDFEVSKEYVELFSWLVEKEKLATVLSVFPFLSTIVFFFLVAEVDDFDVSKEYVELFSCWWKRKSWRLFCLFFSACCFCPETLRYCHQQLTIWRKVNNYQPTKINAISEVQHE